jgi:hypothetical protein
MTDTALECPFVYANGKKCHGRIVDWCLYGGARYETTRSLRLWCSEKDDHEGSRKSFPGRMSFYPNELPKLIWEAVFANPR